MKDDKPKFSVPDKVKVGAVIGIIATAVIINQVMYSPSTQPIENIDKKPPTAVQQPINNDVEKQKEELERQRRLAALQVEDESKLTLDSLLPDGTSIMIASPDPKAVGDGSLRYLVYTEEGSKTYQVSWKGNVFSFTGNNTKDPVHMATMFAEAMLSPTTANRTTGLSLLKNNLEQDFLQYAISPELPPLNSKTMTSMSFHLEDKTMVVNFILKDDVDGTDDEIFTDMAVYVEYINNVWVVHDMDLKKDGDQFGL